jgi:hypothetical protein
MKNSSLTSASWIALLIAILSWGAVAFFLSFVLQMQSERAEYVANASQNNVQEGQATQLRVLARETEDERAALTDATNVDVLSAVNRIESVNASGTAVQVVSAQPVKTSAKATSQQMNVVDLTARAEGSFSSVTRVMQMLETLPLTTTVQEIDMNHAPIDPNAKNNSDTWTLKIRLRFYTTAALST